ncbi:hypothetical protein AB6A40_005825 [Gnathostoma spinigerum]|uniref:Uncharacterized protein n=1 Tax=Gnathostoma spinigerum TaxID=75299 RepID=A0ABD6EHB5_9BILA
MNSSASSTQSVSPRNHNGAITSDDLLDCFVSRYGNRQLMIARSCSELTPQSEVCHVHHTHRTITHRDSMPPWRELPLIGNCKNCSGPYNCNCCVHCNHGILVYVPVGSH